MNKKRNAEDKLSEDEFNRSNESSHEGDEQEQLAASIRKVFKNAKTDSLSLDEKSDLWKALVNRIEHRAQYIPKRRFPYSKILVAALCFIVLGLVIYLYNASEYEQNIQEVARINKTYFSEADQVQFLDAKKKPHTLKSDSLYTHDQLWKEKRSTAIFDRERTHFNSIGVPYGTRSEIVLEDGTSIWLNAGSVLTFPERFDSKQREVFLEGEAYFEVAHDAKRPFYVISDAMRIEVLGTSFNVSAYADDDYASTALLTGNITVSGNGEMAFDKQVLKPGTAVRINKITKTASINENYGAESISWTKRRLLLRSTHLDEIIKKLERFYNAEIEGVYASGSDDSFSGSLDLTQTLQEVLHHLYEGSKYSIMQKERKVYIQKK